MLTAVVADVVRAYVDLRGFQVRAGILHKASDVLRESLRIVNIRYERGITNELDVALATRELATLEAEIAPVEAQVNAAQYTLAVLVGEYPENMIQELSKPDLIPSMPAPTAPGVPLDLLKRRPDIQQAERELAAATARIGVATADLFPRWPSVGSIGSQVTRLGNHARTSANISGPLGRAPSGRCWISARSMRKSTLPHLAAHASLVNYRKTILNAVQQVDTSLDAYQAQQVEWRNWATAMMAGQRAVDLATRRYNRGLTDFLNVVDAERQFYDLQEQYADGAGRSGRAVRAALQEPRRRLAELSSSAGYPPAAAGHHRRLSSDPEQLSAVMSDNLRYKIDAGERAVLPVSAYVAVTMSADADCCSPYERSPSRSCLPSGHP